MTSTELTSEFDANREARLLSAPAKRLIEKLAPINSHIVEYQKRWLWELLQNACDKNSNTKIQIELDSDFLHFRHNGNSFTVADAMNLIFPDSSKDEEKDVEVIGQFGSGFIATHILSSKIRVSGTLVDKTAKPHSFVFNLNRSSRSDKKMISVALETAEEELRMVQANSLSGEFQTEFSYYRDASYDFCKFDDSVAIGMSFLYDALPFTFTFVPQLQEVEIVFPLYRETYARSPTGKGCLYTRTGAESSTKEFVVLTAQESLTTVAVAIENGNIKNSKEIPRLFCAYPMVGTENFPFPCVINNPGFAPKGERQGIELSETDTVNRAIIADAVKAYTSLLNTISDSTIGNRYHMCNVPSGPFSGKEQVWFKGTISDPLKIAILNNKIVLTPNGYKKLNEVHIPVAERSDLLTRFLDLCSETILNIPLRGELDQWTDTLDFTIFKSQKLDLQDLVKKVGEIKGADWSRLLKEETNSLDWCIKLVNYIVHADQVGILQTNKLIVAKSLQLYSLKDNLFWDSEIPDQLKEIYNLLSTKSYDSILLHKGLEELGEKLIPLDRKKTENDISTTIDTFFNNVTQTQITPSFIDAIQRMLTWTEGLSEDKQEELFPHFSNNKARFVIDTLGTREERAFAFTFFRSEKKEILAKVAVSDITISELEDILKKSRQVKEFLRWSNDYVDDTAKADLELGNLGESYINDVLSKRFKGIPDIEIEWVSKTRNEPHYDFEIRRNGEPWLFIDAKTVAKGIANADSIPFFMRSGQWSFLEKLRDHQSYLIARVFMEGDKLMHRFLSIRLASEID